VPRSETSELLWEGRSSPGRGPKPVLSVEQITEAAVRIADEHGLDAVSMQAVADAVGFTKMSLYRHVRGKDELLAVMIEYAVGEPPTFPPGQPWRSRIEAWAERLAEEWRRHPWLPSAAVGHRAMGPREISWSECVLQALAELRLTPAERLDVAFLLFGHLRNTQSLDTAGTQAWNEPGHRRLLARRPDEFSAMLEVTATPASDDFGRGFGLSLILDGVQALHDSRAKEASSGT
jgi:AcrR family transcriptional regulator